MSERLPQLPAPLRERAQQEAEAIAREVAGVRGVVVATSDGFDIASVVLPPLDAGRIAALASSMAAIGEVVSVETTSGRSTSVTVGGEDGFTVVHAIQRADAGLVLNVVANGSALLGQVLYRVAQSVRRLERA